MATSRLSTDELCLLINIFPISSKIINISPCSPVIVWRPSCADGLKGEERDIL